MLDSESIRLILRLCDVLMIEKHKNDIDNSGSPVILREPS